MYPKQVTIKNISKNPMPFCNSRQIDVDVLTNDTQIISISLSKTPMSNNSSQKYKYFDWAWNYAEQGDICLLCMEKDSSYYLKPLTESH